MTGCGTFFALVCFVILHFVFSSFLLVMHCHPHSQTQAGFLFQPTCQMGCQVINTVLEQAARSLSLRAQTKIPLLRSGPNCEH